MSGVEASSRNNGSDYSYQQVRQATPLLTPRSEATDEIGENLDGNDSNEVQAEGAATHEAPVNTSPSVPGALITGDVQTTILEAIQSGDTFVEAGHLEKVKELVKKGVNLNGRLSGERDLNGVTVSGDVFAIGLKTKPTGGGFRSDEGRDIDGRLCLKGRTPLMVACDYEKKKGPPPVPPSKNRLRSRGVPLPRRAFEDPDISQTRFPEFVEYHGCNCDVALVREIVKYIEEKGEDLDAKDEYGKTAFMYACGNNRGDEIVKYLLDKGVDFNLQDNKGKTAFMYACRNRGGLKIMKYLSDKYLSDKGVNINWSEGRRVIDNEFKTTFEHCETAIEFARTDQLRPGGIISEYIREIFSLKIFALDFLANVVGIFDWKSNTDNQEDVDFFSRILMDVLRTDLDLAAIRASCAPIMTALLLRKMYQWKSTQPEDENSDDFQERADLMERVAAELLAESPPKDLTELADTAEFVDILGQTNALVVTQNPRIQVVLSRIMGISLPGRHFADRPVFGRLFGETNGSGCPPVIRIVDFTFFQIAFLALVEGLATGQLESQVFIREGAGLTQYDVLLMVWTVGMNAYEATQLMRFGVKRYFGDNFNILDLAVSISTAVAIGVGMGSSQSTTETISAAKLLGFPVMFGFLRLLHPVCLWSEKFGLIVNTVFKMCGTLARYVVFVGFLMVAFGVSFVTIHDPDNLEEIVRGTRVDSSDKKRNPVGRFLYVTFILTFEGQGVGELIDRAYDNDELLLLAIALIFRIVVILGAMNLVIAVMTGEWSKTEPQSKAWYHMNRLATFREFRWLPPMLVVPPPLNLCMLPIASICAFWKIVCRFRPEQESEEEQGASPETEDSQSTSEQMTGYTIYRFLAIYLLGWFPNFNHSIRAQIIWFLPTRLALATLAFTSWAGDSEFVAWRTAAFYVLGLQLIIAIFWTFLMSLKSCLADERRHQLLAGFISDQKLFFDTSSHRKPFSPSRSLTHTPLASHPLTLPPSSRLRPKALEYYDPKYYDKKTKYYDPKCAWREEAIRTGSKTNAVTELMLDQRNDQLMSEMKMMMKMMKEMTEMMKQSQQG